MTATGSPDDSVFLTDLSAKEIREGRFDTAILPVGATEWHGDHLPFSTDTITAAALAERFARDLGTALVLPPLDYGVSPHLLAWPWTLSIQPATLTAIVRDVGESLIHHGITRFLVVSAHDGNPAPIEAAARDLHSRHGISVAVFGGWQGLSRRLLAPQGRNIDEDHGGQSELSMVLYLRPDLARPERAVDVPNQQFDYPVRVIGGFDAVVPHGHSGSATQATAAEGEAIVHAVGEHVGAFLKNLAANGWQGGSWMSGITKA
jgi:creatinine amidohydrolase